jgi:hypothetical protein
MHRNAETMSFYESALHAELRKLDEAAVAFDAAREELSRLLQEESTPLWQLEEASGLAEMRLKALRYQGHVVKWCREWVEQQQQEHTPVREECRWLL